MKLFSPMKTTNLRDEFLVSSIAAKQILKGGSFARPCEILCVLCDIKFIPAEIPAVSAEEKAGRTAHWIFLSSRLKYVRLQPDLISLSEVQNEMKKTKLAFLSLLVLAVLLLSLS